MLFQLKSGVLLEKLDHGDSLTECVALELKSNLDIQRTSIVFLVKLSIQTICTNSSTGHIGTIFRSSTYIHRTSRYNIENWLSCNPQSQLALLRFMNQRTVLARQGCLAPDIYP